MADEARCVILFEDNQNIQTLLKYFFKKLGLRVIAASDGVEAVELIQKNSPALVIMDLIMPGKDGIEACLEVRKAGIKTPIIMLTSKPFDADRERALAAGVNAYVQKPFNPAEFKEIVQNTLSG